MAGENEVTGLQVISKNEIGFTTPAGKAVVPVTLVSTAGTSNSAEPGCMFNFQISQPQSWRSARQVVDASENFTLALADDGTVWCPGVDFLEGETFSVDYNDPQGTSAQLKYPTSVTAVSADRVVLTDDGVVWSWGETTERSV